MLRVAFPHIFQAIEGFPGLQQKHWELNQSGVDRGMEAVLIQRAPREIATYALVRLRFAAMPELLVTCRSDNDTKTDEDMHALAEWGRTSGQGGTALARIITAATGITTPGSLAADAVLTYYRDRRADNPAVKHPWTEEGIGRLPGVSVAPLLDYPCRGPVWQRKFETVKQLSAYVMGQDWHQLTDDEVLESLESVKGVGNQTASMVALFWLRRPVAVIDSYLLRFLEQHDMIQGTIRTRCALDSIRREIQAGAAVIEKTRLEWPAWRVLSSLYLWLCELGRLHCTCRRSSQNSCPVGDAMAEMSRRNEIDGGSVL